ncbi:hypothetical protein [Komagataeibacter sp. FNDCF1]|uniref:hypothetical protein n=1 Tax=Komagataeibacter sp. FNDCF1 TaxID=2878681 RepID=UPI001E35E02A|nr:hypothetical protein [Komagataeibacter sp. FNDCF1]MCE2563345.1 hypothetical protein [Komagataeibacter sp. FNDCF1]
MTPTSDAAEPDYLATRLTWMEQVELHMRAHNSAPLNSRQRRRLRLAEAAGTDPWDAFEQVIGANNVGF